MSEAQEINIELVDLGNGLPVYWQRLSAEEVLGMCKEKEMIVDGHFVLKSGLHSSRYLAKSRLTCFPLCTHSLCEEVAYHWLKDDIEVVVGPALGGISISHHVAFILGYNMGREIIALYTEKVDGKQVLKTNRDLANGKRILFIEDVVTTGGSVGETIKECVAAGAIPVGCHVFFDRSLGAVTPKSLGVEKLRSLLEISVEQYLPEECPLCKKRVPINTDFGHGEEYLKIHPEAANW